jgi:transcriptional regulator with XRE-family HTH domain
MYTNGQHAKLRKIMTLKEYIQINKISQARFARRCGISRSAINHFIAGRRYPNPETMRRILLATNGEVKPNDFFNEEMLQMQR